ncbi:hypothetical protein K502DRAFT_326377 [Neoconidiobolus thromboides FSU 785]|nr:hypothetical protein K502DRAFT_326377 [Neoconidiobolus thromboides FSU 785]
MVEIYAILNFSLIQTLSLYIVPQALYLNTTLETNLSFIIESIKPSLIYQVIKFEILFLTISKKL